jgi:hypothetical protein
MEGKDQIEVFMNQSAAIADYRIFIKFCKNFR